MQKQIQFVRFLSFSPRKYPVSLACWAMIFFLSFMNVPETPMGDIPFIDKWTHIVMYGFTGIVIWVEYLINHTKVDMKKMAIMAIAAPIVTSGIIELLQEYCTGGCRSGDWLDLAANSLGVALAAIIGFVYSNNRGKV